MAQFDVYRHPVPRLRDIQPYVVEVQSDLLLGLASTVLVPLLKLEPGSNPASQRLYPILEVAGEPFMLSPPELLSILRRRLGAPVAHLPHHRADIVAVLDRLFTGI